MNRVLSFFFVACLAMLSFGAFAQTTYVKVTNASQLVDGGKYLIVYEEGNVALDGSLTSLDVVSNTKAVTISGTAISVTDNDFYFTLDVVDGGYSVKSASGYFIGNTSDANALKTSQTEAYVNTIEVTASTTEIISANTHLRFNSASDQNRFKYFKSTTYTNQKAISLFVDAASLSDNPMISIITPVNGSTIYYSSSVTATVQVLNFTVGTDGNISFAIDSEDAIVGTETSHTFTNLTDGQHTIHVSLVGTDQSVIATATSTFTVTLAGPTYTTIRDIQYTEDENGDSPLKDQTVWVKGVVTSNFINTPYSPVRGYSIQDANEAWSGIWVFDSNNNPNIGDSVKFQALVTEYYGLTELKNVANFEDYGQGTVSPIDVTVNEANSEAYEGCYVRVECVRSVGSTMPYGNWACVNETGDTVTFSHNFENGAYTIEQDANYMVSGVVEYSYGKYYVNYPTIGNIAAGCGMGPSIIITNPANGSEVYASSVNATVEVLNFTPGTDGNISFSIDEAVAVSGTATSHTFEGLEDGEHTITASLVGNDQSVVATTTSTFTVNLAGPTYTTIHDIQYTEDESGDSPLKDQTVWVKGVVTSNFINTPYFPVKGYSIQDANEAWSGVWVFDSINNPNIGDSVKLQATVTEYYNLTELKNVANFEVFDMGVATPINVTVSEVNTEAFEGCYVRVECVRSTGNRMPYGNWPCVNAANDTVFFSHNFSNDAYTIEQDKYYSVAGVVEYNRGYYYVNYPTVNDIIADCDASVDETLANAIEVYPNPTNGQINIANAEGKNIVVINTLGQVVASINNATENQTIDMSGLCEGTYFVKVGTSVVKINVIR